MIMIHYRCAVVSACLLSLTGAHAGQYCGDLKRDSAAYFACEALNKQEIIEQNRQREQENSDLKASIERQARDAEERSRREQERSSRERERITREQNQEKQQHTTELMPIAMRLDAAMKAIAGSGGCDRAQQLLDEARTLIASSRPIYFTDGAVTTKEQLRDVLIGLQSSVYVKCLNDPQRTATLLPYLDREAKGGSQLAKKLFDELKQEIVAEIDKTKSAKENEKNRNVPSFADFGTDMSSLDKYEEAIFVTSIEICREGRKKKNVDATFCMAQHSVGEKKIALLREASNLGHPIAKNNLAMYLDESEPPGDSAEIAKLVRSSANSGIPHAQVTVGWWHMKGKHGFPVNYAEAMKWNLKAYKQGHSEGANNIGELYANGLGVPADIAKARSWFKKASVLGNEEASVRLNMLSK